MRLPPCERRYVLVVERKRGSLHTLGSTRDWRVPERSPTVMCSHLCFDHFRVLSSFMVTPLKYDIPALADRCLLSLHHVTLSGANQA